MSTGVYSPAVRLVLLRGVSELGDPPDPSISSFLFPSLRVRGRYNFPVLSRPAGFSRFGGLPVFRGFPSGLVGREAGGEEEVVRGVVVEGDEGYKEEGVSSFLPCPSSSSPLSQFGLSCVTEGDM